MDYDIETNHEKQKKALNDCVVGDESIEDPMDSPEETRKKAGF